MINCLRFVTRRRWPRVSARLQDKLSSPFAFPNEEAIILRDVSNGRGTMNPVTTFCPGWWLKANDPPPSFFPSALVLPFAPWCLWTCLLLFLFSFLLSSGPSNNSRGEGRWWFFSRDSVYILRFLNRRKLGEGFIWNLEERNLSCA